MIFETRQTVIQTFKCGPASNRQAVIGHLYRDDPDSYTLKISGKGPVSAPKSLFHSPWGRHAERIRSVEIGEGITEIESGAFADLYALESAYFP